MNLLRSWKKSTFSGTEGECVELAWAGGVRDSKNTAGPVLTADWSGLVTAVKAGNLPRC
jgi:hypothetical protein